MIKMENSKTVYVQFTDGSYICIENCTGFHKKEDGDSFFSVIEKNDRNIFINPIQVKIIGFYEDIFDCEPRFGESRIPSNKNNLRFSHD